MSYVTKCGRASAEGLRQARRARVFAESFMTYAGESELCGEPYEVSDWMWRNIWKPLFATGSVDKRTGRWVRRFRRALIGVHRGFGKSQVASVIVMTVATMEALPNGIYGIVADTKDNTLMIKNYLKTMIRANRQLSAEWKIYKDVIRNDRTGQEIIVFPYKEAALQGKHFHVLVGDEVHVWKDGAVWDAAVSGQAKVRNALTIGITTAGSSRDGLLFKLYQRLKTDRFAFISWLGITDSDKVSDRRCWRKITAAGRITMEELEEQFDALPLKSFERYYLNRTPMEETEEPFMRRRDVEECAKRSLDIDWSKWFAVGIDGAVNGDTLAMVAAQRRGEDWALACWAWEVPGAMGTHDLLDVADVLQDISSRGGNPLAVVDPARMQLFVNTLYRERGMELVEMAQSPRVMCPASELLAYAVRRHRAALGGDGDMDVLARHCVNARSEESKAFGRRMTSERHGRGTKRIDAAIAAAMAMYAYDNNEPESPGVWTIDL